MCKCVHDYGNYNLVNSYKKLHNIIYCICYESDGLDDIKLSVNVITGLMTIH